MSKTLKAPVDPRTWDWQCQGSIIVSILMITPRFVIGFIPLTAYSHPHFRYISQSMMIFLTSPFLSSSFNFTLSSLPQIFQYGLEDIPDRCPERLVFWGSTRSAGLCRLPTFARYQSLCILATNYRMRRPIFGEKLRARGNFWRIIPCQKQSKHPIPDRISPPQDVAIGCERIDHPASKSHGV